MADKKTRWVVSTLAHGADLNWDWNTIELLANEYVPSILVENVSGYIESMPTSVTKCVYAIIGITDAGGSFPFDTNTLATLTNDALLDTFIDDKRKNIWMTLGGFSKANVAVPEDIMKWEFNAKSKRKLLQGQKLYLIIGARNHLTNTAENTNYSVDMTTFFS